MTIGPVGPGNNYSRIKTSEELLSDRVNVHLQTVGLTGFTREGLEAAIEATQEYIAVHKVSEKEALDAIKETFKKIVAENQHKK